jgi:DNA-directed RNA polymerase I subunit RPA43
MSSETPAEIHDTSKRKEKKHKKDRDESSSKKRKRGHQPDEDEILQVPNTQTESQPPKKHKKDKDHRHKQQSATPTPATVQPSSQPQLSQRSDLKRKVNNSPFIQLTTSLYLPLSPCAYTFPLQGLCAEHISPNILTYYPPLQGVLLAYSNPRLSEDPNHAAQPLTAEHDDKADSIQKKVLTKSINEYGVSYIWLTAEFVIFRPRRGCLVEGWVGLQSESLLGLVCYNYFNAVVEREKLPGDWRWVDGGDLGGLKTVNRRDIVEGGGYFVDGEGKKVQGKFTFRVEDFEVNAGTDGVGDTISIIGTLRE